MQQRSKNNRLPVRIYLLLLCLTLSSLLLVGVTFGRYQQEFPPVSYPFIAEGRGSLVLGGVVTQDWLDSGKWPAVPTDWITDINTASLDFSISNGRSTTDFTQRNQTAIVRLVTGLGVGEPENMAVKLTYYQDEQPVTFIGRAEKIHEGSLAYQHFGQGWVYRFYDAMGDEIVFTLTGGTLSYQNLTVTLTGETDPVLCQLQIFGS